MQYPGPTLIVNQGDTVKIVLNNTCRCRLDHLPGTAGRHGERRQRGLLTREARAASWTNGPPTPSSGADLHLRRLGAGYLPVSQRLQSGSAGGNGAGRRADRSAGGYLPLNKATWNAYPNAGTNYDRENLFLLTEMNPAVHWQVYTQVFGNQTVTVDTTTIRPSMWFINGRNAPDTMLEEYVFWLPTQPYNALPRMHPGERLLMRVINAGRDLHPFHHHGNHATPIAVTGASSQAWPAAAEPDLAGLHGAFGARPNHGPDLSSGPARASAGTSTEQLRSIRTPVMARTSRRTQSIRSPRSGVLDHNKPLPVTVGGLLDLSFGESYSGSPYLGMTGSLPQGHPGLNTTGGYFPDVALPQ